MKKLFLTIYGVAATAMLATPAFAYSEHGEGGGGGVPDLVHGWDHLWFELMMDILVIGIIFAVAAIYMLFKYKAKSPDDVGDAPRLSTAQALGWLMIPAFIFMADDIFLAAKGWVLWNEYRNIPENSYEIKVTGSQWAWEFDYGDGVTSDVLNVPAEKPVVLRMTSDDVIHSFGLIDYRVTEDLMPGRVTYLWFLPHAGDKSMVTCREYCGTGHSAMFSDIVALSETDFSSWLASEKAQARNENENNETIQVASANIGQ
jgi:cytochrome c oxidase subunit 2